MKIKLLFLVGICYSHLLFSAAESKRPRPCAGESREEISPEEIHAKESLEKGFAVLKSFYPAGAPFPRGQLGGLGEVMRVMYNGITRSNNAAAFLTRINGEVKMSICGNQMGRVPMAHFELGGKSREEEEANTPVELAICSEECKQVFNLPPCVYNHVFGGSK